MTSKVRTVIALATAAFVAAGSVVAAQTATPDAKKTMKHHARKSATPAGDMYLRAAGSEPAPKAAK